MPFYELKVLWPPKGDFFEAHQWWGEVPVGEYTSANHLQSAREIISQVREYRHPGQLSHVPCTECGRIMHEHGWIDQGIYGIRVCPGDWIVEVPTAAGSAAAGGSYCTGNLYFPIKPGMLEAMFERKIQ